MNARNRSDYLVKEASTKGGADSELELRTSLGRAACGHRGIVHGGAIAAVLDDAFGVCFLHAGLGSGFTASLKVDYRKPVPAEEPLRVKVRVVSIVPSASNPDKKKVTLAASVYGAEDGKLYTEATALFIVAPGLSNPLSSVKRLLGIDKPPLQA